MGAEEAFAIEGVPVRGVDRAVGVLDDDGVDGKIDVGHFADGKILTEGSAGDGLDLAGAEVAAEADGVFVRFGDETFVEFGLGSGFEAGVLKMELVVVAGLDDEFFAAARLEPVVE